MKKPFKCVPFNPDWVTNSKLDLYAIYRRPVFDSRTTERQYHDDGRPKWDLTSRLPIRRHNDWMRAGFEYVTLATRESLCDPHVVQWLRENSGVVQDFEFDPHTGGPWHAEMYLAICDEADIDRFAELKALVEELGSDAVIKVQRTINPKFDLPEHMRDVKAGGKVLDPKRVRPAPRTGASA